MEDEKVFIDLDSLNEQLDQINNIINNSENNSLKKDELIRSIYLENKEIKELEKKIQEKNENTRRENKNKVNLLISRKEPSTPKNLIRIRRNDYAIHHVDNKYKTNMSENEALNDELNTKRETILNKMVSLNELYKNIKPKIEIIESLLKDYILSKGKYIFQTSQIFDENRLHLFDDITSLQNIKVEEYYDLIHFLQDLDSLSNREKIMTIFPPNQPYPNKIYPALFAFYDYLLKKERENKDNERYERMYNTLSSYNKLNVGGKSMKKRRKQKKLKQTKKKLYKSSKVKRSMK
jgi:hypothetical protein